MSSEPPADLPPGNDEFEFASYDESSSFSGEFDVEPMPATAGRTVHDAADDAPLARPQAPIDHEELIDMTAMVDIVFFLLIFFLVTSMSGLQSSMPMPNPEAQSGGGGGRENKTLTDYEEDPDYVVVKINRENGLDLDGIAVDDVLQLVQKLKQRRGSGSAPTTLLVVGHPDAFHGTAVAVMDAGYDAGLERVRLTVTGTDE